MSELTQEQLRQIMPHCPKAKLDEVFPVLVETMKRFEIANTRRIAAFLATLAVESAEFKYSKEIADGSAYEGRKDLGNIYPGDGRRFKGRGYIQNTGRDVYEKCGDYFGLNLIDNPKLMEQNPLAMQSAGWFWAEYKTHMNEMADQRQFLATQTKVNGRNRKTGLPNNWTERKAYYERALRVLPEDLDLSVGAVTPLPDESYADYSDVEKVPENPENNGTAEIEKGITTQTSTLAADDNPSGVLPPAPAVEVKASQPSIITKLTSMTIPASVLAMLAGVGKFVQGLPPWVWVTLLGVALLIGAYLFNEAQKRAHERTIRVMSAAADPSQNNVRLV